MNIFIDKVGFVNKGAELMLCSIADKVRERYPDAQIVLREREMTRGCGAEYCKHNNMLPVRWGAVAWAKFTLHNISKRLNPDKCSPLDFVHSSQVDVVIDAGGFRFGDQWNHGALRHLRISQYYSSFGRKCKVVFMPQSFGPFAKDSSKRTIRAVLNHAGLIYSREEISLNYLRAVAPSGYKIGFKRDFTLLQKGVKVSLPESMKYGEYLLFIVNRKMITHSAAGQGGYLDFMSEVISHLKSRGEKIVLLNHEGAGDESICHLINEKVGGDLPIITNLNAMEVKGVIAGAKLLLSSRFHGVVSGIVQRVPTFCTSWSHKYNELLSVYQLDNNIVDINCAEQACEKFVDALDNPQKYITSEQNIERERASTKDMWSEIFNYIESKRS